MFTEASGQTNVFRFEVEVALLNNLERTLRLTHVLLALNDYAVVLAK